MELIVETGSGLREAESYISIADAGEYHLKRANQAWLDAEVGVQAAALIKATVWLDALYRGRWLGWRASASQALEWPRRDARDGDGFLLGGVPRRIPHAVAEAALAVVQGVNLQPLLKRGGYIKRKRTGPLETEFLDRAPTRDTLTTVTDLVRGYTRSPGVRITV